ncbi:MAG: hypothetical protein HQL38_18525 [Alphaproteobacteria bacterium]|nr:hypothetical protein [Alphaproteobacteria bacterium]
MTLQTGVAVDVAYEAEASFGLKPDAGGGRIIRRTASSINLRKESYQPNEVRSDFQIQDFRHGARRVEGSIEGELSLSTYDDFVEAALRGTWAAGVGFIAGSGTGVTVSDAGKTFTRAGGSWLTDGFKIGDVVRFANLDAGIDGRNLRVVGLTATVMTVAEAPGADVAVDDEACSCAVVGRKLTTGVVARSFAIEHVYNDVDFSQVFTGCRIGEMRLSLPPSGVAKVTFGVTGKDMELLEDAAAPWFTAPAPATTTGVLAAVDGVLRVAGVDVGVVTGLDLTIALGLKAEAVVGANTTPDVFYGRTNVTGNLTAFLTGGTLLKHFLDEDEVSLHVVLNEPGGTGGFVAIHLPRLKFTSGDITGQGEQGLPIQLPFQALLKADGGAGTAWDKTTIGVQVSNA